jgi:hypothetical protein
MDNQELFQEITKRIDASANETRAYVSTSATETREYVDTTVRASVEEMKKLVETKTEEARASTDKRIGDAVRELRVVVEEDSLLREVPSGVPALARRRRLARRAGALRGAHPEEERGTNGEKTRAGRGADAPVPGGGAWRRSGRRPSGGSPRG